MDASIQDPLRRLSRAVGGAIARSAEVEAALGQLRAAGCEAHLAVEVSIGLSRVGAAPGGACDAPETGIEIASAADTPTAIPSWVSAIGPADREYLRTLRIRLDE